MTEEAHYKLLRLLEQNPHATQREIAGELGISVGKVNYCIQGPVSYTHLRAHETRYTISYAVFCL